jgi:hypothetical protein
MARQFARDSLLAGTTLPRRSRRSVGEFQSLVLILTAILCYYMLRTPLLLTRSASYIIFNDDVFLSIIESTGTHKYIIVPHTKINCKNSRG